MSRGCRWERGRRRGEEGMEEVDEEGPRGDEGREVNEEAETERAEEEARGLDWNSTGSGEEEVRIAGGLGRRGGGEEEGWGG